MKLTQPTDFEVLDSLSDGKRDVAANIAQRLQKNRAYLNTRLPHLNDYGLVEQIGPAEKAGLYEITEKGLLVVEHQDLYNTEEVDFDAFIEAKQAESR